MRIALYASTISSVKRADAPRDTSEGKSHGSWDREVLSPSPPEVSSDMGEGGYNGPGEPPHCSAEMLRIRMMWGIFTPIIISITIIKIDDHQEIINSINMMDG